METSSWLFLGGRYYPNQQEYQKSQSNHHLASPVSIVTSVFYTILEDDCRNVEKSVCVCFEFSFLLFLMAFSSIRTILFQLQWYMAAVPAESGRNCRVEATLNYTILSGKKKFTSKQKPTAMKLCIHVLYDVILSMASSSPPLLHARDKREAVTSCHGLRCFCSHLELAERPLHSLCNSWFAIVKDLFWESRIDFAS